MTSREEPATVQRPSPWIFVGVLLAALVVRGGFLAAGFSRLSDDPDGYLQIAENLARHRIYGLPWEPERIGDSAANAILQPTAYRPPLYPLCLCLLAGQGQTSALLIAVLHALLGVSTVAVTYELAVCLEQPRLAPWAALGVAGDPILLNQSTLIMTETLAAWLASVCLLTLVRWSRRPTLHAAILAGALLGFAVLCRPVFLPFLALILLAMAARNFRTPRDWRQPLCLGLAGLAVMTPWAMRNVVVFGRPIFTTTHGGYTLLLANNDSFYQYLRTPRHAAWNADPFKAQWRDLCEQAAPTTETQRDALAYQQAWANVRQQPGMFARSCRHRLARLWSVVPERVTGSESVARSMSRYAIAWWYTAIWCLVLLGACRLGKRLWTPPWSWGLLLLAALTSVHLLYWTNLRMRAPGMPFLYLLAVTGLASLRHRRRRRCPPRFGEGP